MEKEVKVSAYIKDERTGKYVFNPDYKKATVVETPVVVEEVAPVVEETVVDEVVANAEEAANENVTTEVPAKVKKPRAKKAK